MKLMKVIFSLLFISCGVYLGYNQPSAGSSWFAWWLLQGLLLLGILALCGASDTDESKD